MEVSYYLLDVFTSQKFGGNQLAVFTDATPIPEGILQQIARELNLSETVFIYPPETNQGDYKMRIFTPDKEMVTAGHPTIGTAHLLLNELNWSYKKNGELLLEQKIGSIPVSFDKDGNKCTQITMQQPNPVYGNLIQKRGMIAEILSISENDLMPSLPIQCISCGNNFMYIPVASLEVLSQIKIRIDLLEARVNILETPALYVFTTKTNSEATTRGRMFAPTWGVYEDPATGSASGPLGCYLVRHNLNDGENILCEQGFEMGRPSHIRVKIGHTNEMINKVLVGGEAVLMGKGMFFI
ncbi:MAG: PhzF family phenazine biosynthesis protein [Bacteroidota bacterium]